MKILFLAPTKPLAVQHEKTFKKMMLVPEDKITLFTGSVTPKKRKELWENATIINATPQTIENDLIQGKLSLKDVGLCIFDEAHRAVQNYSYVFLAQRYMKQAKSPLIVALTASPGSTEEKIQEVCKNLFVENIEIKDAKDIDVKPYTKEIEVSWIKVELPAQPVNIQVDATHLEQIMCNLCENGIRYSQLINADTLLKITCAETSDTGNVQIDICDYGTGVSEQHQQELFEPFFTTEPAGTGLGLFIARELSQLNHAHLQYIDEKAHGAHFRLTFSDQ